VTGEFQLSKNHAFSPEKIRAHSFFYFKGAATFSSASEVAETFRLQVQEK
jgi:hypothetical protein